MLRKIYKHNSLYLKLSKSKVLDYVASKLMFNNLYDAYCFKKIENKQTFL